MICKIKKKSTKIDFFQLKKSKICFKPANMVRMHLLSPTLTQKQQKKSRGFIHHLLFVRGFLVFFGEVKAKLVNHGGEGVDNADIGHCL